MAYLRIQYYRLPIPELVVHYILFTVLGRLVGWFVVVVCLFVCLGGFGGVFVLHNW